jgi:predicted dehydrogenase/nucleoside-diphosphate-sugar epimerase
MTPASEHESGSSMPSRSRGKGQIQRVALVGAGYIADWHAQALQSVDGVELVAVCDRHVVRAEALARKFGGLKVYGSMEAMLASERLDALHVLTPPDLHFESARIALGAGVDVFLEKPMCAVAEDCESLVRLAEERGRRVGVSHNFLFAEVYEQLRRDVKSGALGLIDDVTITWHKPLPQAVHGPFDTWMLREPQNIMIEVGSHSVAHLLDLVGEPEESAVRASNGTELSTGKQFYRRWQVNASKGRTAIELRFSFVPGFSEYTIHVRGSLAAATVDFERNTYTIDEHRPSDPDFENYAMVLSRAKSLKKQARQTLGSYIKSKLKLNKRGNPYGASIARAMDAFYSPIALDERVDGRMGARVIEICARLGELANPMPGGPRSLAAEARTRHYTSSSSTGAMPRILVLGGTGFIGKELLRQLIDSGLPVRALVRSVAGIPTELRAAPNLECVVGDLSNDADLKRAMEGVETVFHLARAQVKSWADYQEFEIEVTRRIAECALVHNLKRFIYTGTIDSYYAGAGAGTITEETPLDKQIERRNLYARSKAASEGILTRMHRERGLPLVIVRPGIVIGRGGSPFHWGVGMWWSDALCQIWGEGKNKLALVLAEDVAAGLIAAMKTPGIEGRSFNLVGDPLLTAQEYLDELDRADAIKIQRHATPIVRFYLMDMMKWVVKAAVRHPERRLPSYHDWQSRTGRAVFDCTAARVTLGWKPVGDREEFVRLGIVEPFRDFTR